MSFDHSTAVCANASATQLVERSAEVERCTNAIVSQCQHRPGTLNVVTQQFPAVGSVCALLLLFVIWTMQV